MLRLELNANAVIFDMDGVITNTMPDHFRSWQMIFEKVGIKVDHNEVYRREGQQGLETIREIFAERQKSFHLQDARQLLQEKETLFKKIVKVRFILGVRSFLKSLYQDDFQLALVTGTSRSEVDQILPHDIYKLFSVIVTGTDVQNGKPHPEPYQKALKQLSIEAEDGVVLENAPFGIQSAKSAGLRCLAVQTSLSKEYLKEADYIFDSIEDIQNRISFKRR